MIPQLTHKESLSPLYASFLETLESSSFSGEIERSYGSRLAVATDNSVYQWLPQAVLLPKNSNDIVQLMQLAARDEFCGITFSARGGGTGTNGQSLNDGIIVDLSRHMNAILEVNKEEAWVRVEAGLVKDHLNKALKPYGLFFAPELSTSNRATIGGMVNTDASGHGSLVYGKTSHHVLEITAVLEDGSRILCTPLGGEALQEKLAQNNREGEIYRQVWETARGMRSEIEESFPQLNRFLTGYDLKHAYIAEREEIDLSRLFCGSEGTLAFVCEIKLSLNPIPASRILVNVKYDSFQSALRNAPFLLEAKALSVETVDSRVLNLAREDIVWHSVRDLITDVPGKELLGLNIVEFAGSDSTELEQRIDILCNKLDETMAAKRDGVIGYQICSDLESVQKVYAMRKKAVGLLGNTKGARKPVAFVEDTVVPPHHLADYVMEFRSLLDSYNLSYGMFGHVDCGALHVRPALDLCDPQQERLLRTISDEVVALTSKYGGLLWGEHGRGFRSEYGEEFFGETLFRELRKIKGAFDPQNRLNPGKICTPIHSDAQLVSVDAEKRATFNRTIPEEVRNSFSDAIDCNGNGLCFNFDRDSPMCPSFKQTGDRRHSPKGRAGVVREWLRQLELADFDILAEEEQIMQGEMRVKDLVDRVKNSLDGKGKSADFSSEVLEIMQGCLACKACSSQCPVKVDVADFRSRFINFYYQRYLRPLQDYMVAAVERYAPLMAKAPGFVNFFIRRNCIQKLTEKTIGMVDVPLLSEPSLKQQIKEHRDATEFAWETLEKMSAEERKKVVLIVQDPFTSYYDSAVVRDLIVLVKNLGYRPLLAPFLPNGKPEHIKGFLRSFTMTAKRSAVFLNRVQELEITMLGPDPAMVLCYRDEYTKALAEKRGSFNVQLLQEWLLAILDQLPKKEQQGKIFYLLGHCTEKTAKPSTHDDWSKIFDHFGGELKPVEVGCCGMAGTYGHAAKNLENSQGIYNLSWGPALAKLPHEQCLVSGYSCRSQVKRMKGEKLRHPLQALLELVKG